MLGQSLLKRGLDFVRLLLNTNSLLYLMLTLCRNSVYFNFTLGQSLLKRGLDFVRRLLNMNSLFDLMLTLC